MFTYVWMTSDGPSLGGLYKNEDEAMDALWEEWESYQTEPVTREFFDELYAECGEFWITGIDVPEETIVVVQRHPDYSDDILSFGRPIREIYIDLGSSFDITRLTDSDIPQVAEFIKGLRQEVEDLSPEHGARVFVEETITQILEDHPDVAALLVEETV